MDHGDLPGFFWIFLDFSVYLLLSLSLFLFLSLFGVGFRWISHHRKFIGISEEFNVFLKGIQKDLMS